MWAGVLVLFHFQSFLEDAGFSTISSALFVFDDLFLVFVFVSRLFLVFVFVPTILFSPLFLPLYYLAYFVRSTFYQIRSD